MNSASSYSYQSYLMNHSESPYHLNHVVEFSELSRRICIETINEIVPPLVEEISSRIVKDILNGNLNDSIKYDVKSIANVSIRDFNTMFKSEAFSSWMSNAIAEEIRKRINEIDINLKL